MIKKMIQIVDLDCGPAMSCRLSTDDEALDRYAEARREGKLFPPVVVFDDGVVNRLADGLHRVISVEDIGGQEIEAEVYTGGEREAILHAATANLAHGVAASRADKRYAVESVLRVAPDLADREIGRRCGVDGKTVAAIRKELFAEIPQTTGTRTVQRGGTTFERRLGVPRTRADERNAVETLLKDEEWGQWSDQKIGNQCKVDWETVAAIRKELTAGRPPATKPAGDPTRPEDPPDVAEGRRNGTIPADVVVEVTGPREELCETEGTDGPSPPEAELTDEQYLESLPARAKLAEPCRKRFDREALACRSADPLRLEYFRKIKPILKQLDRAGPGHMGPWRYKVRLFLSMNDPGRWEVCVDCNGTGQVPLINRCPGCHGDGYKTG